jgi:hypothetical protein
VFERKKERKKKKEKNKIERNETKPDLLRQDVQLLFELEPNVNVFYKVLVLVVTHVVPKDQSTLTCVFEFDDILSFSIVKKSKVMQ